MVNEWSVRRFAPPADVIKLQQIDCLTILMMMEENNSQNF